jgi:hypothetical protein
VESTRQRPCGCHIGTREPSHSCEEPCHKINLVSRLFGGLRYPPIIPPIIHGGSKGGGPRFCCTTPVQAKLFASKSRPLRLVLSSLTTAQRSSSTLSGLITSHLSLEPFLLFTLPHFRNGSHHRVYRESTICLVMHHQPTHFLLSPAISSLSTSSTLAAKVSSSVTTTMLWYVNLGHNFLPHTN